MSKRHLSAGAATMFATLAIAGCSESRPPPSLSVTQTTSAISPRLTGATQILAQGVADDGLRIPIEAAAQAGCVAVVPQAFHRGQLSHSEPVTGIVTCRTADGQWSKPGFFVITAGPTLHQVDPRATDLVIITDEPAASIFTEGDGRPPRGALTCYAHVGGAFVGADLGPVYIKPDTTSIRGYYHQDRRMSQLLRERADDRASYPFARAFDWARAVIYPDTYTLR
jgi:hypothetical protein